VDWVILEAVIVKNDGPIGIWIKIHLNPNVEFLISNLVPCCMVTSIFYLSSSVLNEIAIIKSWSNIELLVSSWFALIL
jgi:hypothetical protein